MFSQMYEKETCATSTKFLEEDMDWVSLASIGGMLLVHLVTLLGVFLSKSKAPAPSLQELSTSLQSLMADISEIKAIIKPKP